MRTGNQLEQSSRSGGDWPQWRGPDGMGVSSATGLPVRLDPGSPELIWKAEIPGEGISSPVVQGERVFLSTAYPGELGSGVAALRLAIPLFALLALALLIRRRPGERPARGLAGLVLKLDALALFAGVALVGVALNLLTFRPSLFFDAGAPGYRWFHTGAVALAGLALAGSWFAPGSRARLGVVLAVCAGALFLERYMPLNKYTEPFRLSVRLAMLAPGLALAAWHVLAFAAVRRRPVPGTGRGALGAFALAGASVATFALANGFAPRAGLVRAVVCLDLRSGALLWNTPLFVAPEERKHPVNSFATPTPCATSDVVFAHFGAGYAALDPSGAVLWQSVDEDFEKKTRYGASTSPVLFDDSVIYLHDRELELGPSYIERLRLSDGRPVWHREYDSHHNSYTTPLMVEREGEPEGISVTYNRVYAFDPRTGEPTWSTPVPIQQMVPSLQLRGDLLLVSGGSHLKASTNALRLAGKGKDTQVELVWQSKRAVPDASSPVLVGDCFLTVNDGGVVTCFDPETGDERWRERLPGTYFASLVAGDGMIYALNDEGHWTTLRAGREFEVLAQGDFDSPCYATPAIAGDRVLVRTEHHLHCFASRP